MAKWVVQIEQPPGGGTYMTAPSVPVQPTGEGQSITEVLGFQIFEDGWPDDDFSGWGEDWSNSIQYYLAACGAANNGISYACLWIGNYPELAGLGLRAQAKTAVATPPVRLILPPSKGHPKPPKPPKHPHR